MRHYIGSSKDPTPEIEQILEDMGMPGIPFKHITDKTFFGIVNKHDINKLIHEIGTPGHIPLHNNPSINFYRMYSADLWGEDHKVYILQKNDHYYFFK